MAFPHLHSPTPFPPLLQTLALSLPLCLLAPLLLVLYNLLLHPLRSYPGPLLYRASRIPWVLSFQTGNLHTVLLQLHQLHGPVVRIAPNELSYTDPAAWKDIYTNPRIKKSPLWFRRQDSNEPFTIVGSDENAHAKLRRAFAGGFSDKALRKHAIVMEGYVESMIVKLKERCHENGGVTTVNFVEWMNIVTFDVAGDLCFGSSFGSTERGEAHPWVEISNQFGKGVALMASINHYEGLSSMLKYIMPQKVMEKMRWHKQLAEEKVLERAQGEERSDLVQSVLDYNKDDAIKEKGRQVTLQELQVNMPVILFAGSETTGSSLDSTIWYLLRNLTWLQKAKDEVKEAFSIEGDINTETTSKLDILTAIISEGIRLGPPALISTPRVIGKGGEVVCGQLVPEGTILGVHQYPTFRMPASFTNPNVFDPSRFLGDFSRAWPAFKPFSLGRHGCIGEKFAWAEMRVMLARLLFSFDMSLVPGSSKLEDWGEQKTFLFWQKEKLDVRLKLL